MRKLTERDIENITGSTIKGYHVEDVRVKDGPYIDSDHYGFILGKNAKGHYATWHFHLLDDDSVSVYWGHYFMEDRDAAIRDFNNRDKAPTPQKFRVTITETLKRTVEVVVDDQYEAEQIVSDGWHSNQYILSAEDFADVAFEAVVVMDGPDGSSMEGV